MKPMDGADNWLVYVGLDGWNTRAWTSGCKENLIICIVVIYVNIAVICIILVLGAKQKESEENRNQNRFKNSQTAWP